MKYLLKFEEFTEEFSVFGLYLATQDEIDEVTEVVLGWGNSTRKYYFGAYEFLELEPDTMLQMIAAAQQVSDEQEAGVRLVMGMGTSNTYGYFPKLQEL